MKKYLLLAGVLCAEALWAAPAGKAEPVAEGYPDWQGLTSKAYIMGRELCPSDLRHRAVVVIDVEPNDKLQSQFVLASRFVQMTGLSTMEFGANWETMELPRDMVVVLSFHGTAKDRDKIKEALTYKGEDRNISVGLMALRSQGCGVYDEVTFTGSPDTAGKLPYVYVMGPTGKEPLYQGTLDEAAIKPASAAVRKAKKEISDWEIKWRPFFGNVDEPKFHPQLAKALEKGKTAKLAPLAAVSKAILKNVESKDEEKAKEAQVLYDAINQTRSDLVMRIKMEASACPHRAYYDIQQLIKYWPSEKKRVETVMARMKAIPEAEPLAKMFCKVMVWADPDFTCKNAGEAKKIVQELNKMKKTLEKLKESKVIVVQNGALILDSQLDDLIGLIPTKVPSK